MCVVTACKTDIRNISFCSVPPRPIFCGSVKTSSDTMLFEPITVLIVEKRLKWTKAKYVLHSLFTGNSTK